MCEIDAPLDAPVYDTVTTTAKCRKGRRTTQGRMPSPHAWETEGWQDQHQEHGQARHPDEAFTGSLASKNKGDLQDIAGALKLSDNGTKDALIQRINSFFDSNPLQRDCPRFSGLFHRASRRRPQETDMIHPIASTSQIPLHNARQPLTTNITNQLSRHLETMPSESNTYANFFAMLQTNPQ